MQQHSKGLEFPVKAQIVIISSCFSSVAVMKISVCMDNEKKNNPKTSNCCWMIKRMFSYTLISVYLKKKKKVSNNDRPLLYQRQNIIRPKCHNLSYTQVRPYKRNCSIYNHVIIINTAILSDYPSTAFLF